MITKMVLWFSTIYLLLLLILMTYITYTEYISVQTFLSNSLMSENSVSIAFTEDNIPEVAELLQYVKENPKVSFLSLQYKSSDLTVYGFLGDEFLQTTSFLPKTESYLQHKSDSTNKNPIAIVGENTSKSEYCFYDESGNLQFNFIDYNYLVQNIISLTMNNMNDNTAFVELGIDDAIVTNKVIIDARNLEDIYLAEEFFKQEYKGKVINENQNFVKRYIFNSDSSGLLDILIFTLAMTMLVVLTLLILRNYSQEIKVKYLVGVPFKRIIFSIVKNVFALVLYTTLFFSILYFFIYNMLLKNFFLESRVAIIFLIAFLFSVILFLSMYLYMLILVRNFYKNGIK